MGDAGERGLGVDVKFPGRAGFVGDLREVFGDGGDLRGPAFVEGDDQATSKTVRGGADGVLLGFPFGDFGFAGVEVASEIFSA